MEFQQHFAMWRFTTCQRCQLASLVSALPLHCVLPSTWQATKKLSLLQEQFKWHIILLGKHLSMLHNVKSCNVQTPREPQRLNKGCNCSTETNVINRIVQYASHTRIFMDLFLTHKLYNLIIICM